MTEAAGAFGSLLRRFRRASRLSQAGLASEAGFSTVYVSMLERGERQPPEATVRVLADAMLLTEAQADQLLRAAGYVQGVGAVAALGGRLPRPLTSFVGRRREIAVAGELLRDPSIRLVTLTGPGGVGKTRLAIEVARSLQTDFDDGVGFVPLQSLSHADSVPRAVADSLGVRPKPGTAMGTLLAEHLIPKHLLLVIDNFEHLLPAAGLIGELLSGSPRLLCLVTSRVPLGLSGEHAFPVKPFPRPASWTEPRAAGVLSKARRRLDLEAVANVAESDAGKLFVDRARAGNPDFALTHHNASQIGEICRVLDGLPLAIELAAARAHIFPLEMVIEQLRRPTPRSLGALTDTHPRHHSLHAAFEWSYELLDQHSKEVFAALSVFAGSWTFGAAAEVCDRADEGSVEDAMAVLVDASLVQVLDSGDGDHRFAMLETIREFAREKLRELGQEDVLRERHLAQLVRLGEQFRSGFRGSESEGWVRKVDAEYPNITAALGWSIESNPTEGLRLAGAIGQYWDVRGRLREGRTILSSLLHAASLSDGDISRADATGLRAQALTALVGLDWIAGDMDAAERHAAESLDLHRLLPDERDLATAVNQAGIIRMLGGRFEEAEELFDEALALCSKVGDERGIYTVTTNLGVVANELGHYAQAAELSQRAADLSRKQGDVRSTARALNNRGFGLLSLGDGERAAALARESLALRHEVGDPRGVAESLVLLAGTLAQTGDWRRTTRVLGAAATLRDQHDLGFGTVGLQTMVENLRAEARRELGDDRYESAWTEGAVAPLDHTVRAALSTDDSRDVGLQRDFRSETDASRSVVA